MHKYNIIDASYDNDYKINLRFNNGVVGTADLNKLLFCKEPGVFRQIRNKNKFKNFKILNHTLHWENDIDLAPEYLYQLTLSQK